MPVVSKDTLKSYFNSGDVPNESNYIDLIDTMGLGGGDMSKDQYDIDDDGVVDAAESAPWAGITGKPLTFAPSAHATSHKLAGSDVILLDEFGLPGDNTNLNASTSRHGLLRKLSNVASEFLNGVGNWVAVAWADITDKPTTFTPSAHQSNHLEGGSDELLGGLVDYSATSTIVGWSSFTSKFLVYKKIGRLVFVNFNFIGTSNSTSTSFTLPFTNVIQHVYSICRVQDNGGTIDAGLAILTNTSNTVSLYKTINGGGWTATGTKAAQGQFIFVTSS